MEELNRTALQKLMDQLKQDRDELKLKIHLGKKELKDEWEELQDKLAALERRLQPTKHAVAETADDVWESVKLVGGEIRAGFNRIRKSL